MGVDIGVGVDTPNNRCIGCRCRCGYTYTYIYIQHPFFGCTIVWLPIKRVLNTYQRPGNPRSSFKSRFTAIYSVKLAR